MAVFLWGDKGTADCVRQQLFSRKSLFQLTERPREPSPWFVPMVHPHGSSPWFTVPWFMVVHGLKDQKTSQTGGYPPYKRPKKRLADNVSTLGH